MLKREAAESIEDNTRQPGKKPKTMEIPYRDKDVTASPANVLKDINTYTEDAHTEDAQAAKNTGPTENFSKFTDFYGSEMKPDNNAAKRENLLRDLKKKLPASDVEQISDNLNRYRAKVRQDYSHQLEKALNPQDAASFIQVYKQKMKLHNNAAKRENLRRDLKKKLPASDVEQRIKDVDKYHTQVAQYHHRLLEEILSQPYVNRIISSLEQQQKK
jgi:hypothetical protein